MALWKVFQKAGQRSTMPAAFKEGLFEKPGEFSYKVKNMAVSYETASWMLREGIVEYNPNKWGYVLSKSHRDFNDYWTRTMFTRCGLFLTGCWLFSCLYTKPRFDWQDYHDPKFEQKTYGDLEEGGDEGGDDD
ncbi:unnamed protein product [Paramecium primaurelia]|uniref:Uncharacterized protein n=2 Tax=Paramecium TaxID=5884 RepID=A0A8S1QEB5_PARPR|nr:unnamed protein product [Paramecium primaurelia]CAD8112975.1 unnamed protein product [Paramecium primaurelia]CAD8165500.1 unnamed protein product [Paramecium pentaurelia]CAD8210287.1 unnamed protein product [Paramecium pentaurelia]